MPMPGFIVVYHDTSTCTVILSAFLSGSNNHQFILSKHNQEQTNCSDQHLKFYHGIYIAIASA